VLSASEVTMALYKSDYFNFSLTLQRCQLPIISTALEKLFLAERAWPFDRPPIDPLVYGVPLYIQQKKNHLATSTLLQVPAVRVPGLSVQIPVQSTTRLNFAVSYIFYYHLVALSLSQRKTEAIALNWEQKCIDDDDDDNDDGRKHD